jgi:hypothetical protein
MNFARALASLVQRQWQESNMKKVSDKQQEGAQTRPQGEEERDNDAHRPDGSTGTSYDSTAQKTARDHVHHKR